MQTTLLNLAQKVELTPAPQTVLSFGPFINYLRERKLESGSIKAKLFSFVIEQFEAHPELLQPIEVEKLKVYSDLLQLIYTTLSPIIEDEESQPWAISMPLLPLVFYGTNAYYKIVSDITTGSLTKTLLNKDPGELLNKRLEYIYSLILEKCYGVSEYFSRETVHSLADSSTGIVRYYRMTLDTRFIDVKTTHPLPEIDIIALQSGSYETCSVVPMLQSLLPLDMFRFEGFGITTLQDVTPSHSISRIRNLIVNHSSVAQEKYYASVIESLKSMVGQHEIEYGLMPVLRVNGKLIFNETDCMNSKLLKLASDRGVAKEMYMSLAANYFEDPKTIFYREITAEGEAKHEFLRMLKAQGVKAYALVPVFFNNNLAGVLEVYSLRSNLLDETLLSRLDPVMPLLAQLLKNSIDDFNSSLEKVIKEKFTAVQPSVQWKFNEAAWHFLRDSGAKTEKPAEIEDIEFEQVYPLYGAIDIRNSTIERNAALYADLKIQFTELLAALQELRTQTGFALLDEKIYLAQQWMDRVAGEGTFSREVELNEFLENDITPFLLHFIEGNPEYSPIVEKYFHAIDEHDGIANEHRRELESSMNTVISAINNYLESMKEDIQKAYPSYFEKFRTDGVEYDIYIGQAIAPGKPYNDIYLKNLRLMQVSSMATIAKLSTSLRPQLARQIETTQLIFIHSHPINIKFRKDEKRFDVEGAYNIRYHIVKKRIDKVRIKDTRQRLTQPGKIALVYLNQREADEYVSYIKYLQTENILLDDLEYLDLEELQGVSGLKALRVGVNIPAKSNQQNISASLPATARAV